MIRRKSRLRNPHHINTVMTTDRQMAKMYADQEEIIAATPSVSPISGQLAGALYGASRIPQRWLDKLAWGNAFGRWRRPFGG